MKKLLILPVLAVAVWTGIALYWQVRIGRATRVFETTELFHFKTCSYDTPPYERASHELLDAGVRALPALMRSLDPQKRPAYLTEASVLIRKIVTRTGVLSWSETKDWMIEFDDSPAERARKCRLLQDWWLENAGRIGHWWQPWERGYSLE
jgi:hypothetical protein